MTIAVSSIAKILPLVLLALAGGAVAGAPAAYAIVGIGPGRAYHISPHGEVAGSIDAADGAHHAFIFTTQLDDLGNFGGTAALASAVNASGDVTGVYASVSNGEDSRGVLYRNGEIYDIGSLGKYPTIPLAINAAGLVVGYATTPSGARHAFLFAGGKISDLGTLGGSVSIADDINDQGTVAGWSNTASGHSHAFLCVQGAGLVDAGVLKGGSDSEALAINNNGVAVGHSTDANGVNHAVRFNSGKLDDLGLDNGSETYAEGIDDNGDIVGWASNVDGSTRGILFSDGHWTDLASLLPQGSGWTILTARAINDSGQITGEAIDPNGVSTIYLMSPSPYLSEVSPSMASAGASDLIITLQGFGFNSGAQATWNGQKLATDFVSSSQLTATVPAALLKSAADCRIAVTNPGGDDSDDSQSEQVSFHIAAPDAPEIGAMSMHTLTSGSATVTLLINGSNFQQGDVAMLDGQPLATTLRSPTQLAVIVPAAALAEARTAQITIARNDAKSNPIALTIAGPGEAPPVHTYPAGLQLLSAPGDYTGEDLTSVMNDPNPLLVTWSPASNAYSVTPDYPSDTLHAGHAYWARFARPVELISAGAIDPAPSTNIPLAAGWNMIGSPIAKSTRIDSLQIVDLSGRFYSWRQATALGIVVSPLYSYDSASNSYVSHANDTFDPYVGYWLHVSTACSLVVSAVKP